MSNPLTLKTVRNTLLAAAALIVGLSGVSPQKLFAQAASTQYWTGITPSPADNTSYTLNDVGSGIWDGTTANWANAGVGTNTSYYAFTAGSGRIASFLPKTGGYTVTLAYDTPVLRALSVAGGNTNGKVTIKGDVAHTITFNGTNSYIVVSSGRELTIGANTALKGDFSLHLNGGGILRWSGAAAAYQDVMTLQSGTFIVDADAAPRMGSNAKVLIQDGATFQYNGATALNSSIVFTKGTLGGSGRINSAVTVGAGMTLAPGVKVGSQEYANLTLAGGGRYEWQIGSWLNETAGIGYDTIVADHLTLTANAVNPFVITLQGLNASGVEGILADFNSGLARQWRLIEWLDGLDDPEAGSLFQLDAQNFEAMHLLNGGSFSLGVVDNGLTLFYAPVPEASTVTYFTIAFGGIVVFHRARRKTAVFA